MTSVVIVRDLAAHLPRKQTALMLCLYWFSWELYCRAKQDSCFPTGSPENVRALVWSRPNEEVHLTGRLPPDLGVRRTRNVYRLVSASDVHAVNETTMFGMMGMI